MSGITLDYLANEDIQNQNSKSLDYNVVRFLPDINQLIIEEPNKSKFLVKPEYDSDPLASHFYQLPGSHTPQSCAMNAAIIDATARLDIEKNGKKDTSPQLQPGLSFVIAEGYFNDNIYHFEPYNPKSGLSPTSGVATDFTSIVTSTNKIIPALHTIHYFSVKWIGYFYPNESGTWNFSLNSDDSSLMWLGDKAINDYSMSNLTVDCRNLHGMYTRTGSMYLEKDTLYPIRIYFGENWGGNNCIFGFKSPSGRDYGYMGSGYNGKTGSFLYTNGNDFSTNPMIHPGTYFSLVNQNADTSQAPNFGCYIYGKKTKDDIVQGFNKATITADYVFMQKNLSDVIVTTAWSLIDTTTNDGLNILRCDPNTSTIQFTNGILYLNQTPITKMIQSGNGNYTAILGNDGQFIIKDSAGKVVWGLQQINNNDDYTDTPAGTQRIASSIFPQIVQTAQPNNIWISSGATDTLTNGQKLSYKGKVSGTLPYLISRNGKFKIDMDNTCNLNLKISMTITPDTIDFNTGISGQPSQYKYTDANDQFMYLNLITADSKMLNTYSYLSKDKEAKLVNPKSNVFNYKTSDFTQYNGYYPSSTGSNGTLTNDGPDSCQSKCKSNADCMYYYTYSDNNGSQKCYYNTDNTPLTFAVDPMANGSNINPHNSTLYVKNPDLKISNYFGNANIIKSKSTNDYKSGLPIPPSFNPSPLNSLNMIVNQDYEQEYVDYISFLTNKSLGSPLYVYDKDTGKTLTNVFKIDGFVGNMETRIIEGNETLTTEEDEEIQPIVDAKTTISKSPIVYNFNSVWDAQNPAPPGFSQENPIYDNPNKIQSINFTPTGLFGKGNYKDNSIPLKQFKNPDPPKPMLQFFSNQQNSPSYKGYGNITQNGLIYEFPNMVQPINWNQDRFILTTDPNYQKIQNPNPAFSFASIEGGIQFPKQPVVGVGHNPGITFSFWFRSDFSPEWSRIFDFGQTLNGGSYLCCCIRPNGIGFYDAPGWNQIDSSPYVQGGNDGKWHYIYWSISDNGEPWNIYIDNVKQTIAFPTSGIPDLKLTSCLFGASLWYLNGDPFLNGAISDLKIFDCILEHNYAEKYYNYTKANYTNVSIPVDQIYIPMDRNGFQFGLSANLCGYSIKSNGTATYNGAMAYMYKGNLGKAPTPEHIISNKTPGTMQNRMCGSVQFDGNHFVNINQAINITNAGITISFWFDCTTQSASIAGHLFTCFNGNSVIMGAVVHNNNMWIIINGQYYNTTKTIVDAWQKFIWVVNPDGTSNLSINGNPLSQLRYTNIIQKQSLAMYLGANYTWYYTKNWNNMSNMLLNGGFETNNPRATYNQIIQWNQAGGCGGHDSRGDPWGFPSIGNKAVIQGGGSNLQQSMFIPPSTYNLGYWHSERPGYGATTYTITVTSNTTGKVINKYDFASDNAIQRKKASRTTAGYNTRNWSNVNVPINVDIADYYTITIRNNESDSDNSIGLAYMILVTGDVSLYRGYMNKLHIYNKALSQDDINNMNNSSVDGFTNYEPFTSTIEGMNNASGAVIPGLNPAVTAPAQAISGISFKPTTITYKPAPPNYTSQYKSKSQMYSSGNQGIYSDGLKNTQLLGDVAKEYGIERNQVIQNLKTSGDILGINTLVIDISGMKHQMGDNTYGDDITSSNSDETEQTVTTLNPSSGENYKYQYGDVFDKDKILYGNNTVSVAKNDARELILQENTIYSVGLITCATLLIVSIMIARE